MATSGMFDWNPMSQSQMDQAYLKSIIDANTGENYGARFGAGLGLSLGRMFGGQTAQEAEQNIMKDVFSQAAQEQDPVKRLQTAATLFRQKGMEGRAQQLEAQAMNMVKSQQDLTLGGMNIQSLIDERNARVQALKDKATASEEALAQRKNLVSFVQRKIPGLSASEAEALVVSQPDVIKDLVKPLEDKTPAYGAANEATAKELYGTTYKNLTSEQAKAVNLLVQKREESAKKAGATTLAPVIKTGGQVTGLVQDYENLTKGPRETLATVQSAKALINEAASTNNSQTWEAARTQIAKAVGEGKLSNEDIRRTGQDPRLVQGALDWVNKKISGVPNEDIMKQLYVVGTILERKNTEAINKSTERLRRAGKLSGMEDSDLEVLFPGVPTGKKVNKTKSGTAYEILGE